MYRVKSFWSKPETICLCCNAKLNGEKIVEIPAIGISLQECSVCESLLYSDAELWELVLQQIHNPTIDSWIVVKIILLELDKRQVKLHRPLSLMQKIIQWIKI